MIIGIVAFIVYFINYSNSIKNIEKQPIAEITIEHLPKATTVKITDREEIKFLIEKLELNRWEPLSKWELKLSPNLWIKINEDTLIGFFGSGETYAKVEIKNRAKYYKIPSNIYDEILGLKDLGRE
jgi:hypothetical protein